MLDDENENVAYFAANALESIGPAANEAVPKFLSLMNNESKYVRSYSASALGWITIDPEKANSTLLHALQDPEPLVVESAANS